MSLACLEANPDISGIGVRVSIYAQALLALVPAFAFSADGIASEEEYRSMKVTTLTTLITACAILLSALTSAAGHALSVHHALIILNLSWINNTNALVYIIFYVFAYCELSLDISPSEISMLIRQLTHRRARVGMFWASLHLCAIAGLGLWVWVNVRSARRTRIPSYWASTSRS
jgi:hypothetical protein